MMSQLNFVLPINTEELLTSSPDQYYVREVLSASRVSKELKGTHAALLTTVSFTLSVFFFSSLQSRLQGTTKPDPLIS